MDNLYDIVTVQPQQQVDVPFSVDAAQTVDATSGSSASQTLSCCDMYLDGIKAVKRGLDPVSDVLGMVGGVVCCVTMCLAQAEENERPATRRDAVYAAQERRRDQEELGCAFAMGYCLVDAAVDTTAMMIGGVVSGPRAMAFSFFGNNQRDNTVFGVQRSEIDNVDLFSSCASIISCCNGS